MALKNGGPDLVRAERAKKVEENAENREATTAVQACPSLTFNNVTPDHFAAIAAEVEKETGMQVSGNSGTTSEHGFTVTWDYNPETQDLTMQCTEKPWIIPTSVVQHKITEIVQGHIGA